MNKFFVHCPSDVRPRFAWRMRRSFTNWDYFLFLSLSSNMIRGKEIEYASLGEDECPSWLFSKFVLLSSLLLKNTSTLCYIG